MKPRRTVSAGVATKEFPEMGIQPGDLVTVREDGKRIVLRPPFPVSAERWEEEIRRAQAGRRA